MYDIIDVTDDSFEQEVLVSGDTPVLVDFWADWCPPCKTMTPLFESLAQQFGDKVKFVKANVDKTQKFAAKLSILSIPTFILFEGGTPKAQHVGTFTDEEFGVWLDDNIAKTPNPN